MNENAIIAIIAAILMGKRVYWVSPQEDPSYITEPEPGEIAVAIRVARSIYQAVSAT